MIHRMNLNIRKDLNIDWSQDPKALRELYKQLNFDNEFYKLIGRDVISILSPQLVDEPHNLIYDDEIIQRALIGRLEKFIFGLDDESATQDDINKIIEHIKTLKQPSKICRKVLKTGDVLFSCNDCGSDATCVVCIDCFHKSAHKDHNYRMSNTDGGGCCDCGDVEAWKQFPACSDHMVSNQPNLTLADFEDTQLRGKQIECDRRGILEKISLLTNNVAERYFLVCQASLHYARLMLTWDNYDQLPECLQIDHLEADVDESNERQQSNLDSLLTKDASAKNYFTVLFNDEVHTYDHVINTLVKIIRCSKMTASIMASTVSREGRSLILNDVYKECKHVRDAIAYVRDSGQGPLKVGVIHGTVLAHQAFALKLIEWLQRMSLLCDAFRVLTAYTLLGTYDPIAGQETPTANSNETLLERIMLSNTSLWKVARIDWNDLFVTTLLTEYSIKEKFARLVTRIYPKLMQDFIEDDHDHSVSILTMTTQLYTVPSLICMLVEEENALSIISQTLLDTCRNTKRESSAISFENRNTFDLHSLKRGFYIISDLRHLINIEPTKWTPQLRSNVIQAVKIFLNLLQSMQGMDSVKRQLGQHLEYEPEWETGMTLQSRLISFITRLVTYCSLDENVLTETLRETQNRLFRNGSFKTITKDLFGHHVGCIQYDVSTSPVSVHLPLTRFAAALILELMLRRPSERLPYNESLVILVDQSENKHSMIDIMEPSLRTEVMIAQFRSGMWRRNGFSLVNQILYFSGPLMRREMFDRDILVLQECAACCDANEFLIHMLNKFNLFTWVSSETTREPLFGPKAYSFHNDEEIMTQTMSLGEEFLQLLLTIVGERYRVGVGKIQAEDVIRNEIIQLLCIGPFTRSDLTQKLYVNDNELDCIKAVANLRRSTESSTGKYELKPEYYDRFNRFFYHYNRRHQSQALDAQLKRKRNLKEALICCPPPAPVELTEQFKNLNELLKCDITLIIIQKVLRRALGPPEDSQECSTKAPIRFLASDLQLDQCLHLIGLGLFEQERDPKNFRYLEAIYDKDIFNLLKECYERAKRSKDMIFWIMKRTSQLVEFLLSGDTGVSPSEYQLRIYHAIKSRFSQILSTCDTVEQESKKRSSELAAQRRERIMAQMKAKQKEFLSNPTTQKLIAETEMKGPSKPATPAVSTATAATATTTDSTPTTSGAAAAATTNTSTRTASAALDIQQTSSASSSSGEHRGVSNTTQTKSTIGGNRRRVKAKQSSSTAATATTTGILDIDEEISMEYENAREELVDENEVDDQEEEEEDDDDDDELMDSESLTTACEEQPVASEPVDESHLCILCRDEQKIGFDKPTMVLLAYIQRSAVLSKNRGQRRIPNYALTPSNQLKYLFLSQPNMVLGQSIPSEHHSFTSDNSWSFDATFMPSDMFFGPYISTCGHVMHYDCWQGFFDAVVKRETSRPNRSARHTSFDLDRFEILCPLCECISNATIPLLPDFTAFAQHRADAAAKGKQVSIFSATATNKSTKRDEHAKSSQRRLSKLLTNWLHILRQTVDLSKYIRHSATFQVGEDKRMRLLQPKPINDVLVELEESEALMLRQFITEMRTKKIPSSICTKNLLSAISTLANRIHSVGLDLDKSISEVPHDRIFMMTSWTIAYTIQALERAARFRGAPLFADLESSKNLCLSSLLRYSMVSMMTHQPDMMQSLLVSKLGYLMINEKHLSSSPCCLDIDAFELFVSVYILSPKLYSHIDDSSAPLNQQQQQQRNTTDTNSSSSEQLLSSSFKSTTSSSSNQADHHQNYPWTTQAYDHDYFRSFLNLMLILNLVQVTITIQNDHQNAAADDQSAAAAASPPPSDDSRKQQQQHDSSIEEETLVFYNFYAEILIASGHPIAAMPSTSTGQLIRKVRARLLPFLRSCAIFFYHLTHIKPSELLQTKSAFFEGHNFPNQSANLITANLMSTTTTRRQSSFASVSDLLESNEHQAKAFESIDFEATDAEFETICQYLDLPNNFGLLLESRDARQLVCSWLRHSRVLLLIKSALKDRSSSASTTTTSTTSGPRNNSSSVDVRSLSGGSCSAAGANAASSTDIASSHNSSSSSSSSNNELIPVKFIRQPHMVNRLIDLPYDYSELVDRVSDFTCPSIRNEDSRTPTMCLVCGVMLCSQSYCCQRDLNDLASNYKQILRRQEEVRRQLAAVASQGGASDHGGAANQHHHHHHPHRTASGAAAAATTTTTTANQAAATEGAANVPQLLNRTTTPLVAATTAAAATVATFANSAAALLLSSGATSGSSTIRFASERTLDHLYNAHINQQLVGSCTYHAHECSGGVGVFLRIRNCQILLLSGRSKGCYMAAPYIDDHGETDFGLMRGNPLHLNKAHYERLQQMWMSHSIPEQISRTLEYSSYASNINWHLH